MGGGRCTECHTHHSPQTIKGAEPAAKAAAKPEPAPKAAAQEVKK
jgi:hypothetical protein